MLSFYFCPIFQDPNSELPPTFQQDGVRDHRTHGVKESGFDPTKANINGTTVDDYEARGERPRKEGDDSRRSSYDTNQRRRGSVQGGYRQPIPSTNVQQYPSYNDGLASRATDATSTLKDSGYSDAGGGSLSRNQTPEDYLGTGSSTEYDSGSQLHRPRQMQRPMLGKRNQYDSSGEGPPGPAVRGSQQHQQGELLKTIVDDYDQPGPTNGYQQQRLYRDQRDENEANKMKYSNMYRNGVGEDMREGGAFGPGQRPLRDKPNLISPEYMEGQDR